MEIKDYENYLIFKDGEVFSIKRNKLLIPNLDANGYKKVNLCKNNKPKQFRVHRLIALYYIPNPDNKPCVDHIDRDRTNNNINNLRWVTYSENNLNKPNLSGHDWIYKHKNKTCKKGFIWDFVYKTKKIKSSIDLDYLVKYRDEWLKANQEG